MRALVTGGTGFIGNRLVAALMLEGHGVRCLVREPARAEALRRAGAELVLGDVGDLHSLREAVRGCDRAFHLAAVVPGRGASDARMMATNVEGTRNVLEAARMANVGRFVFASSAGVHGATASAPADEGAPFRPRDAYDESKLRAEALVHEAGERGLAAAILRPVSVYGPGDRRFLRICRAALGRVALLLASGRTLHHMVYVDDLVRALLLAATRDAASGGSFLVAGPRPTTIEELYRAIARIAGQRAIPLVKLPARPLIAFLTVAERLFDAVGAKPLARRRELDFFTCNRAFRTDRARDALGFTPAVDLDEGIRTTLAWYRREGWIRG